MTPLERTAQTLATLDPTFAPLVHRVLIAMRERHTAQMVAYSGRRTTAEQRALYAQGRTSPGAIVTYCDGVVKRSKHQDGTAVDCAFVVPLTGGRWMLSWAESYPWSAYGAEAVDLGLTWGGAWRRPDKPHIEVSR